MFLHVEAVTLLDDYVLRIEFSDGAIRDVDLSQELRGEVFEPLRDPELFAEVAVNHDTGTIEWPSGADMAPEFLYEQGTDAEQVA
ncbi:MAG: DUF2442 domain-containing protein [Gemmatimonadetes bacterium]|nr:DUF2442 domain-containing protein [Gemmatimonadota bacterium]NNM04064.1 DUF2442 domain-containing protein [Gemmatimonadota bacterium]